MTYRIWSKAGLEFTEWTPIVADSPAEALAIIHRDAGYVVSVLDDDVVFSNSDDAAACGYVSDWIIKGVTV